MNNSPYKQAYEAGIKLARAEWGIKQADDTAGEDGIPIEDEVYTEPLPSDSVATGPSLYDRLTGFFTPGEDEYYSPASVMLGKGLGAIGDGLSYVGDGIGSGLSYMGDGISNFLVGDAHAPAPPMPANTAVYQDGGYEQHPGVTRDRYEEGYFDDDIDRSQADFNSFVPYIEDPRDQYTPSYPEGEEPLEDLIARGNYENSGDPEMNPANVEYEPVPTLPDAQAIEQQSAYDDLVSRADTARRFSTMPSKGDSSQHLANAEALEEQAAQLASYSPEVITRTSYEEPMTSEPMEEVGMSQEPSEPAQQQPAPPQLSLDDPRVQRFIRSRSRVGTAPVQQAPTQAEFNLDRVLNSQPRRIGDATFGAEQPNMTLNRRLTEVERMLSTPAQAQQQQAQPAQSSMPEDGAMMSSQPAQQQQAQPAQQQQAQPAQQQPAQPAQQPAPRFDYRAVNQEGMVDQDARFNVQAGNYRKQFNRFRDQFGGGQEDAFKGLNYRDFAGALGNRGLMVGDSFSANDIMSRLQGIRQDRFNRERGMPVASAGAGLDPIEIQNSRGTVTNRGSLAQMRATTERIRQQQEQRQRSAQAQQTQSRNYIQSLTRGTNQQIGDASFNTGNTSPSAPITRSTGQTGQVATPTRSPLTPPVASAPNTPMTPINGAANNPFLQRLNQRGIRTFS